MRSYLLVSGVVFGAVTLLHVLRLVLDWPAQVGSWAVPLWFSWCGVLAAGALCAWALSLAARGAKP
jgi:hypothetical protein